MRRTVRALSPAVSERKRRTCAESWAGQRVTYIPAFDVVRDSVKSMNSHNASNALKSLEWTRSTQPPNTSESLINITLAFKSEWRKWLKSTCSEVQQVFDTWVFFFLSFRFFRLWKMNELGDRVSDARLSRRLLKLRWKQMEIFSWRARWTRYRLIWRCIQFSVSRNWNQTSVQWLLLSLK